MHRVFVYGTLKRGEPNEKVLNDPGLGAVQFIATARTVRKFPLTVASEFNIPYLLFEPGCGKRVVGEVFEIEDLSRLDEFERCPGYYSRVEEEVEFQNGDRTRAWLYVLENFKPELLEGPLLSEYSSKNGPVFNSEALQKPSPSVKIRD